MAHAHPDAITGAIRAFLDEKARTDPDDEERIAEIDAQIERMMNLLEEAEY